MLSLFSHLTAQLPVGRFAPSPTGHLHLGSLTTAIASYCHIKSIGGDWLVRMEDTDYLRCDDKYSRSILTDLERLGLHWDKEVLYQSERSEIYNRYLDSKLNFASHLERQYHIERLLYRCQCSRKQLKGHLIYPRYCLHKHLAPDNHKVRIQLPNYSIGILDRLQGMQWQNPQLSLGDVVLRRANGMINYFLAVSIDDGLQGVTHVMRGLDILPLTCAQIALMQYFNLPAIQAWYHLPLVKNKQGQKLSKQNLAAPIDTSTSAKCRGLITTALMLLKQAPVCEDTPAKMLNQAISQWDNAVLHQQTVILEP